MGEVEVETVRCAETRSRGCGRGAAGFGGCLVGGALWVHFLMQWSAGEWNGTEDSGGSDLRVAVNLWGKDALGAGWSFEICRGR